MGSHKQVVESPIYREARQALGVDCKRLDEILDGLMLELATRAKYFPRVDFTDLYRARSTSFSSDVDEYCIWFRIEQDSVILEYISVADRFDLPTGPPPFDDD